MSELPGLGEDRIHIWSVHLPDMLDRLGALRGLLSAPEREKAARFHRDADRQSSIAARGALRVLLSGYTGIPAAEIEFHYSENGKPHLLSRRSDVPVAFNVSHSGDWVLLAFGRNRQVGIDVEKIKREMDVQSIASRYFAPEEIALIENTADAQAMFFQLWARKEAYVKACGSALFRELGSFAVPMEGERGGWFFQGLEIDPKYAAAVVADKELGKVLRYGFGGLEWDS